MPRKKRIVFRDASQRPQQTADGSDDELAGGGTIKAINTWANIEHDEEDQFFETRDKVLLDYDKRNYSRPNDDDVMSEEEVFGLDGTATSDEEDEEENDHAALSDDDDDEGDRPGDDDLTTQSWGRTKKSYYNADHFSDLEEAREEEVEAIRLQKKRVEAMVEEDFLDDMVTWKGGLSLEKDEASDRKLVDDVNRDLENISFVTDLQTERIAKRSAAEFSPAEALKILQSESPELIELLDEFKEKLRVVGEVEPVLERTKQLGITKALELNFLTLKHQLLLNYLTNISFYLVLKSSGAPQLRDHPVIAALVDLRTALEKIEKLEKGGMRSRVERFVRRLEQGEVKDKTDKKGKAVSGKTANIDKVANGKASQARKAAKVGKAKETKEKEVRKAVKRKAVPEDMQDDEAWDDEEEARFVTPLEQEFKSLKKVASAAKKRKRDTDFGESNMLELVDAEDKIIKKKSLRDYVAKIDQVATKRQARYQGDVDIPYKDRIRRDQTKGVAQPSDGTADLDDADWNESDHHTAASTKGGGKNREPSSAADEDDPESYYESVKAAQDARKQRKLDEYEASKPGLVEDGDSEGDKRGVTWQILKNKGLTPHRKKEQRNARVKHRSKYEKKMKKLGSVKRVVKPLVGAYGGEGTGIKTKLSRSIRLG